MFAGSPPSQVRRGMTQCADSSEILVIERFYSAHDLRARSLHHVMFIETSSVTDQEKGYACAGFLQMQVSMPPDMFLSYTQEVKECFLLA